MMLGVSAIRARVLPGLFFLLSGLVSPALAAPDDYEGLPVQGIEFAPVVQPLPPAELDALLAVRPGEPFRIAAVRETIERLYLTGRYEDIQIRAGLDGDRVLVTIETEQRWFVGSLEVEGVRGPPTEGQLANSAKLELGSLYAPDLINQATVNMESDLQRNGYFGSRIATRITRNERTQEVYVRFIVETDDRARFITPLVEGTPGKAVRRVVDISRWRGWFGWRPFTDTRTQDGLDRLRRSYQRDNHLMADVQLRGLDYNEDTHRVSPHLYLDAGPRVRVQVRGAGVSQGDLRRFIPIYEERSVDRDLLEEGSRNLTEDFQSRGFFNAQVDFELKNGREGEQIIEYLVELGERGRLVHIAVEGNEYFDTDTIRERLAMRPASFQVRRGRFSQNILERDLDAIRDLYLGNGFRDVQVTSEVVSGFLGKPGEFAVFIEIEEGPQWTVADFSVAGIENGEPDEIRGLISSTAGQIFSGLNISIDRDVVLAYYYELGFSDAGFEWDFEPGEQPNTVRLQYRIAENERQFLREVLVNGAELTDPTVIWRRIHLRPGDPLSTSQIVEVQRRLYGTGVFAKVNTAIQNPEGEERYRYIVYDLEEAQKYSVTGGFGAEFARIGGDQRLVQNPTGATTLAPRLSFDFTRLNLRGKAHTASLKSRLSTLQKRALFSYLAPELRGWTKLDVAFTALYDDSRNIRTFSARRWEGSFQFTHAISRIYTAFYRLTYRYVTLEEDTLRITPELIPLASQPIRVGSVSGTLIQDRRDDPINSTRGIYNTLDFSIASRALASGTDFTRLVARNSTYHRVGQGMVFARTVSLGWLFSITPQVGGENGAPVVFDIPLAERFFSGGASSHRGFPDNQAGPRDLQTGFPIGGSALFINSAELRFPLMGDNIGGVLFHDAGNIYRNLGDISVRPWQRNLQDFNYMVHAVGFGVRYNTPIGPVRLDLAYSINPPRFIGFRGTREELLLGTGRREEQQFSHFQFHFSLGQTF